MNADQYKTLLQELGNIAGVTDTAALMEHGRLKIGELDALLAHDASYDEHLLQLRIRLGGYPHDHGDVIQKALLEANYVTGYGGECVFSMFPDTEDVVITMKLRLGESLSPQELWQELTGIAQQGMQMWESIASAVPPAAGFPPGLHTGQAQHL